MRLRSLVLIDFGLALFTDKMYGRLNFSLFCGTRVYMSKEMSQLEEEGSGFINLRQNDLDALQKSIRFIKERNLQRP
jgi:serine/threonine protein kinase